MQEIIKAFAAFQDQFGLNQINGTTSDNGVLFTSEYILCISQLVKTAEDKILFEQEVSRVAKVFETCESIPGVQRRSPSSTSYDSMDNHTARLAFDGILAKGAFALRMIEHDTKRKCAGSDTTLDSATNSTNSVWFKWLNPLSLWNLKGFWNNHNPDFFCFFSWFGRSPGMMAMIDFAAKGHTSWFRAFGLWVSQVISAFSSNTNLDGWKLSYMSWWLVANKGPIWRLTYRFWVWKLLKTFGVTGMSKVYSTYYQNLLHPIVTESQPFFIIK